MANGAALQFLPALCLLDNETAVLSPAGESVCSVTPICLQARGVTAGQHDLRLAELADDPLR